MLHAGERVLLSVIPLAARYVAGDPVAACIGTIASAETWAVLDHEIALAGQWRM